RLGEVQAIIDDGAHPTRLALAIAQWAGEPEALAARREALTALHKAPPAVRLAALVQATSGPGDLGKDPLAPEMIDTAKDALSPDDVQRARDMMLAASSAASRQLLASSLARYAGSDRGMAELTPVQKDGIRSDFIDIYRDLPADQQKDMVAAVERMAGAGAAELLRGRPGTR